MERLLESIPATGGIIFILQGMLGFVALCFIIERMIFFQSTREVGRDLLLGTRAHLEKNNLAEAQREVGRVPGAESRLVAAVLARPFLPRTNLKEVAQEAGQLEIPKIERHLRTILGIALIAPLLGMFGTVLGLIESFMDLGGASVGASGTNFAGGIFKALASSAVGLAVALPCYIFYLYLLGKARQVVHRLERTGIETVNLVMDLREEGGGGSA